MSPGQWEFPHSMHSAQLVKLEAGRHLSEVLLFVVRFSYVSVTLW